jgi:hypothetical protein
MTYKQCHSQMSFEKHMSIYDTECLEISHGEGKGEGRLGTF